MRHRAVEAELKQLCSESTVIDYIKFKAILDPKAPRFEVNVEKLLLRFLES